MDSDGGLVLSDGESRIDFKGVRVNHSWRCNLCDREKEIREREALQHPERVGSQEKSPLQVIGFADSDNAFSAISNMQPKSVDKLTKISLAALRDISPEAHMSFIDAPYNIADAGTKVNADAAPFLHLCESRQFPMSFVGRHELKRRNSAGSPMAKLGRRR